MFSWGKILYIYTALENFVHLSCRILLAFEKINFVIVWLNIFVYSIGFIGFEGVTKKVLGVNWGFEFNKGGEI